MFHGGFPPVFSLKSIVPLLSQIKRGNKRHQPFGRACHQTAVPQPFSCEIWLFSPSSLKFVAARADGAGMDTHAIARDLVAAWLSRTEVNNLASGERAALEIGEFIGAVFSGSRENSGLIRPGATPLDPKRQRVKEQRAKGYKSWTRRNPRS